MGAAVQGILAALLLTAALSLGALNVLLVEAPGDPSAADVSDEDDASEDDASEDDASEDDGSADEQIAGDEPDAGGTADLAALEAQFDDEEEPDAAAGPGGPLVVFLGPSGGAAPAASERVTRPTAKASSAADPVNKRKITCDASRAVDGATDTWWQEDAELDGIGQALHVAWSGGGAVSALDLVPGYMKKRDDRFGDRWPLNNRLQEVELRAEGGVTHRLELTDERGWHRVRFDPPLATGWLELEIVSVYPGRDPSGARVLDSGVSEVRVWTAK